MTGDIPAVTAKRNNSPLTRTVIHGAAIELFARNGYHGTSLRDIAAYLGVQAGSLYNHIRSKEQLLFDLMSDSVLHRLQLLESTRDESDPVLRLRAAVDISIRGASGSGTEIFVAQSELRALDPQHRSALIEIRDSYERELGEILRNGVDQGAFHVPDVKLAVFAIIAVVQQVWHWYQDNGRLGLEQISQRYQHLILSMVSGLAPVARSEGE